MGVRHYPDVPRLYVDMDGVIADFEKACRQRAVPPSELKLVKGIYLELEPIAESLSAIRGLMTRGVEVFTLTKIPSKNPYAASEKLLWLREHFPEIGDRAVISPDKGCVGTVRDALVDDHPEWANAHSFRGTIFKFDPLSLYDNTGVKSIWPDVYKFFGV